ncbi:MAG: hypothetical protein N2491_11845 [Negativicutes bacterium]|nr:hypothetical protein [Negativicutes bacterium]
MIDFIRYFFLAKNWHILFADEEKRHTVYVTPNGQMTVVEIGKNSSQSPGGRIFPRQQRRLQRL